MPQHRTRRERFNEFLDQTIPAQPKTNIGEDIVGVVEDVIDFIPGIDFPRGSLTKPIFDTKFIGELLRSPGKKLNEGIRGLQKNPLKGVADITQGIIQTGFLAGSLPLGILSEGLRAADRLVGGTGITEKTGGVGEFTASGIEGVFGTIAGLYDLGKAGIEAGLEAIGVDSQQVNQQLLNILIFEGIMPAGSTQQDLQEAALSADQIGRDAMIILALGQFGKLKRTIKQKGKVKLAEDLTPEQIEAIGKIPKEPKQLPKETPRPFKTTETGVAIRELSPNERIELGKLKLERDERINTRQEINQELKQLKGQKGVIKERKRLFRAAGQLDTKLTEIDLRIKQIGEGEVRGIKGLLPQRGTGEPGDFTGVNIPSDIDFVFPKERIVPIERRLRPETTKGLPVKRGKSEIAQEKLRDKKGQFIKPTKPKEKPQIFEENRKAINNILDSDPSLSRNPELIAKKLNTLVEKGELKKKVTTNSIKEIADEWIVNRPKPKIQKVTIPVEDQTIPGFYGKNTNPKISDIAKDLKVDIKGKSFEEAKQILIDANLKKQQVLEGVKDARKQEQIKEADRILTEQEGKPIELKTKGEAKERIALREGEGKEVKPTKRILTSEQQRVINDKIIKNSRDKLNIGADPIVMKALVENGAFHLENIIRSGVKKATQFSEWSKAMSKDFGQKVKPLLFRIWSSIKKEFGKKIAQIVESPLFPIKQLKITEGRLAELESRFKIDEPSKEILKPVVSSGIFKNFINASKVGTPKQNAKIPNVAVRKVGKKEIPVVRKSGFFATKEIETAPIKNKDRILLSPANMALFQDGFKLGGKFGVVYKKMWLPVKEMVAKNIITKSKYIKRLKNIMLKNDFKITKKNGEFLSDMLEKKVLIPDKHRELVKETREFLDILRDDANIIRRRMGKKEIGFIKNYVSHLRQTSLWNELIDNVGTISSNFDFIIPNEAKNPFAYRRYLKELPNSERNFFHISDRYINAISKDINITPAIEYLKAYNSVLKSRELLQASKYWDRYIREGLLGKQSAIDATLKVSEGVSRGLRRFKDILNKAFLTGKIAWNTATQPLSFITLTPTEAGFINTLTAIGKMFNRGVRHEARVNSLSLKIKSGDILSNAIGEGRDYANRIYRTKIDKWNDAISMFSSIEEQLLHQASYIAGLSRARQLGYKGKDAIDFADLVAERTQSMYNKENRAPVLNSPLITSAFPFQSFAVEMFNHLREATGIGGAVSLNARQRFGKLFRLATGIYLANVYSEAITGRKKTTIGTFFPFAGALIDQAIFQERGRSPVSFVQQAEELIKAGKDFINHGDLRRFRKFGVSFGLAFFGVGGGGQLNNIIDGVIADIDEEVKDIKGNKLFDVKDFISKIKAPIWGVWSTKEGIEYWKRRSGEVSRSRESRR